jgi:hypothetical protein
VGWLINNLSLLSVNSMLRIIIIIIIIIVVVVVVLLFVFLALQPTVVVFSQPGSGL